MRKFAMFIICSIFLLGGIYTVSANTNKTLEYCRLYDEFINIHNELPTATGFIMLDFNIDGIPEILSYKINVRNFDKSGSEIPNNIITFDASYTEKIYTINSAFSIVNGVVKETKLNEPVKMTYLPGSNTNVDTEMLTSFVKYRGENSFVATSPDEGISIIRYIDNEFVLLKEKFSGETHNLISQLNHPIVYAEQFIEISHPRYILNKNVIAELMDKYTAELNSNNTDSETTPISSWARNTVLKACVHNLIPDKMLSANLKELIKNEELIALAAKLSTSLTENPSSFSSARALETNFSGSIYYNEIMHAYINGYLGFAPPPSGYDIYVDTNKLCTREDAALILCNVLTKQLHFNDEFNSNFTIDGSVKFDDDSEISESAKKSVYYLNLKGIINGIDQTHIAPTQYATKEQVIIMCERIYNILN